jgi:hypothetical protein
MPEHRSDTYRARILMVLAERKRCGSRLLGPWARVWHLKGRYLMGHKRHFTSDGDVAHSARALVAACSHVWVHGPCRTLWTTRPHALPRPRATTPERPVGDGRLGGRGLQSMSGRCMFTCGGAHCSTSAIRTRPTSGWSGRGAPRRSPTTFGLLYLENYCSPGRRHMMETSDDEVLYA